MKTQGEEAVRLLLIANLGEFLREEVLRLQRSMQETKVIDPFLDILEEPHPSLLLSFFDDIVEVAALSLEEMISPEAHGQALAVLTTFFSKKEDFSFLEEKFHKVHYSLCRKTLSSAFSGYGSCAVSGRGDQRWPNLENLFKEERW